MLDPNEYVLRRVYRKNGVRPDGTLTRGAYTPSPEDTDGISVYREEAAGGITPEQLVASARLPASEYVAIKIKVADILARGLSVIPKEMDGEPPGHCVVPEFTVAAYQDRSQRQRWVETQEALCKASHEARQ